MKLALVRVINPVFNTENLRPVDGFELELEKNAVKVISVRNNKTLYIPLSNISYYEVSVEVK